MSVFNHRLLTIAAIVLCAGSISAQTTKPAIQTEKSKQLFAQDASTYVSEETYALPWQQIPEHNILWRKRVWYDIEANNAENKAFSNDPANPRKSYLVNILLQAAFDGKIKVYDGINDRFTKALTKEDLIKLVSPGKNSAGFNPDNVSKYRIKGDWLFLKEENKLVWRILGIAPLIDVKDANGNITEHEWFWEFYFGDRDYFVTQKVYDTDMNWDEVIGGNKFNGKIIKVKEPLTQNLTASAVK